MPEDKQQLIIEVKTNAAQAAQDVRKLSGAVNDLGETQSKEAAREKEANEQRTRAAANLRQILEAMLGQLKQMNTALGDVSASSARTAENAERAFKKVTAYERALRKEKSIGDREETRRQVVAKENFKSEQSRNHDRLRMLKILAAGGAVIGLGKMAFGMASNIAGRGMAFVNAGALTGVDTKYMQGLNFLVKGRGGAEGSAVQSIGALSQMLFNIQRGYANPDKAAAQYLGNAPWRGTPQEFLEYLADRLPQLSPQEALAATSGLGLSPELIAMLREAGGSENWRKKMAEAMKNVPDLAKNAKSVQELLNNIFNGIDEFKKQGLEWLSKIARITTPDMQRKFGEYLAKGLVIGLVALIMRKGLAGIIGAHPLGAAFLALGGITAYAGMKATEALPDEKSEGEAPTPYPTGEGESALLEMMRRKIKPQSNLPKVKNLPPLAFNLRQFEDMIRSMPFNYVTGRDYFNLTHGGGNTDNSRQYAVNVENINITTRDDPQSVANAAQDGLGVAMLQMIDRHTAGVYVS